MGVNVMRERSIITYNNYLQHPQHCLVQSIYHVFHYRCKTPKDTLEIVPEIPFNIIKYGVYLNSYAKHNLRYFFNGIKFLFQLRNVVFMMHM